MSASSFPSLCSKPESAKTWICKLPIACICCILIRSEMRGDIDFLFAQQIVWGAWSRHLCRYVANRKWVDECLGERFAPCSVVYNSWSRWFCLLYRLLPVPRIYLIRSKDLSGLGRAISFMPDPTVAVDLQELRNDDRVCKVMEVIHSFIH